MEELRLAVAHVFKRKGGANLTESDFLYSISMDLRWFSPKEAQKLLDNAVEAGLLEAGEDRLKPLFEPMEIEIPMDFKPSDSVLEEPGKEEAKESAIDVLTQIIEHISTSTGMDKQKVMSAVNKKQERMMVDVEVAALMVANEKMLDIKDLTPLVEKVVRARF